MIREHKKQERNHIFVYEGLACYLSAMNLGPCQHTAVQTEPDWGSPGALNQQAFCPSAPAQLAASAARSGTRVLGLDVGSSLPAHNKCYSNQLLIKTIINQGITILHTNPRTPVFCLFGFDVHLLQYKYTFVKIITQQTLQRGQRLYSFYFVKY